MKIISWNVNGLRSLKPGIKEVLANLNGDIVCFQETKLSRNQLEETTAIIDGYTSYFSFPRHISGYSGVATYCKNSCRPLHAEEGLLGTFNADNFSQSSLKDHFHLSELQQLENEGRVLITEHSVRCEKEEKLAVINVYCPRADPDRPERKEYKLKFYQILEYKTKEYLKKDYHVIIVGDINATHKPIDHCDPGNIKEFFEEPARKWLNSFLCNTISLSESGEGEKSNSGVMVDTFRYFNPDKKDAYTCWNSKTNARITNYGTRIDYIMANQGLLPFMSNSIIMPEIQGSDHCPVAALLTCTPLPADQSPKFCTRNWPEFTGKQQTLLGFLQNNCTEIKDELQHTKECFSQPLISRKQQGIKTQKAITHFLTNHKRQKYSQDVECLDNKQRIVDNCYSSDHVSSQQRLQIESKPISSSENVDSIQLQNTEDQYLRSQSEKTREFCSEDKIYKQMFNPEKKQSSVEQKKVWKTLLSGPPPPPLCKGHKEPCVLRTVRKEGPNNGRQFFACCKPNGPSSNPNASCNHFEWVRSSKPKLHKS